MSAVERGNSKKGKFYDEENEMKHEGFHKFHASVLE